MRTIPLTNDARQIFVTQLENMQVEIEAWYQSIGAGWYVNITIDNERLVSGFRLSNSGLVINQIVSDFSGDLMALPLTRPASDIGRSPWGASHTFVYLTRAELEESNASIV